ncbi:outer membrane protein assembly factor BamB family protein [Paractinoplanes maris]|uniref:outer membrane protein assembly factor BamB family protein n=1 Tax=Paractinoplanes maris TaxID=1734446 RepID=UPI002020A895|nr:PQQ-binding-like beta-propeller repeat protein [Actinoplanes maris]
MSTIELGEIPTADGEQPAPASSVRLDRRLLRQVALALTVVLCAVGLTGSIVPRAHGIRPLWSVPLAEAQGTAISRDGLFVHRTTGTTTTITAYELATGAVRWRRNLDGAIGYVQSADQAGLLLIPVQAQLLTLPSADDGSAFQAEVHEKTVAISAATGAEVWRTTGEPYLITGDTALLTEYTSSAGLARMRLIRLSDQGTIWSHDTPGVRSQVAIPSDGPPENIVTATDTGEIKVFAYDSGALVTAARIPWVTPRPEEGFFNDLFGMSDVVVVNRSQANVFDMSVYRTGTMAELWKASDTDGYASPCGVLICINNTRGVEAYDPATGTRRWQVAGVTNAWSLSRDRVVLSDGTEEGSLRLVDAGTGRPVGEPAEGNLAWDEKQTGSAIVLRGTRSPAGRTAVTRWDLRTGHQWLLGTIAPVAGPPCSVRAPFLACIRGDSYEIVALS